MKVIKQLQDQYFPNMKYKLSFAVDGSLLILSRKRRHDTMVLSKH